MSRAEEETRHGDSVFCLQPPGEDDQEDVLETSANCRAGGHAHLSVCAFHGFQQPPVGFSRAILDCGAPPGSGFASATL